MLYTNIVAEMENSMFRMILDLYLKADAPITMFVEIKYNPLHTGLLLSPAVKYSMRKDRYSKTGISFIFIMASVRVLSLAGQLRLQVRKSQLQVFLVFQDLLSALIFLA